jgi:sugar lactone lactonase YvrE
LKGSPHGITLDKDENIYVTEWWDWEGVEKFTKTGEPATDFQIEDQSVLGLPSDIIVDPDGIVYVLKSHNNGGKTFSGMGVHKISADGEYLEFLPVPETVTVPHSGASLMAIDKEGYLYLVDQKGANIIILDPSNGNVKVLDFEYSGHVQGIAFNPEGFMFVPDWESGSSHCSNCQVASIHVFDEYHLPITTIGEYGTEDGKLNATHGLEFDKDGNMYVIDYDNSRLQVFHIDPKVFGSLIYEETEEVAPYTPETEVTGSGGGCLIATAAFGSEMAPQIQSLRELRDNIILQTESGTSFMTGFNQFYYSFSPVIADYERENPVFKEVVKLTLTPLLTSLTLLQYADIDSESEMLGYGISVILLNIGMYFVAPAVLIMKIRTSYNKIVK